MPYFVMIILQVEWKNPLGETAQISWYVKPFLRLRWGLAIEVSYILGFQWCAPNINHSQISDSTKMRWNYFKCELLILVFSFHCTKPYQRTKSKTSFLSQIDLPCSPTASFYNLIAWMHISHPWYMMNLTVSSKKVINYRVDPFWLVDI